MSKYEDPTQLDYRYGGDTVDDFAQKYMKTVAYIFSALNELRSPTGGTLTQNPEAYQLKVDDNKLYIRNEANTDWILLGDVKENFGFRTSSADAFMHESDVADSGTAGKLIRADASGKLNADILGNAAKIADKAIQMGLDLADEDRLVYDKDTDTITNRPLQFKVDGDKIYARKDATTGWVLLGDLKQNLGFRSSTDDAFLTESDVADNGTAGKLIRADVNGKLNVDILGNARKMAGKTFAPEDLQDGQIPVYRTSDGTWHAENKGTVGTGKNLMIMDGDKMLGEYNGDEMKAIDIQKSSLTKALAESTGYGIVSGCEPSINGLTVTVSAGVIHTADGRRVEVPEQSITLDAADATKPRTDVVYLDKYGKIAKLTGELGTPAVAGSNTYTISTNFAAGDTVTFGGVTFACTASTQDANNFALGSDTATSAANLATALNANTTLNATYTATVSGSVITLKEKVAGGGNTPDVMTVVGTGVLTTGNATESTSEVTISPNITNDNITVCEVKVEGSTLFTISTEYRKCKKVSDFIAASYDTIKSYPIAYMAKTDLDTEDSKIKNASFTNQSMCCERDNNGVVQYIYALNASSDNSICEIVKFKRVVSIDGYITWKYIKHNYIFNSLGHADNAFFMDGYIYLLAGGTAHKIDKNDLTETKFFYDNHHPIRGAGYDEKTKNIVVTSTSSGLNLDGRVDIIDFYDKDFRYIKTVHIKTMDNYICQEMCAYDGIIYIAASPCAYIVNNHKYSINSGLAYVNAVLCYDYDGNYLKAITFGNAGELEGIEVDSTGYLYASVNGDSFLEVREAPLMKNSFQSLRTPVSGDMYAETSLKSITRMVYLNACTDAKNFGVGLGIKESPYVSMGAASESIRRISKNGNDTSIYLTLQHLHKPNKYDADISLDGLMNASVEIRHAIYNTNDLAKSADYTINGIYISKCNVVTINKIKCKNLTAYDSKCISLIESIINGNLLVVNVNNLYFASGTNYIEDTKATIYTSCVYCGADAKFKIENTTFDIAHVQGNQYMTDSCLWRGVYKLDELLTVGFITTNATELKFPLHFNKPIGEKVNASDISISGNIYIRDHNGYVVQNKSVSDGFTQKVLKNSDGGIYVKLTPKSDLGANFTNNIIYSIEIANFVLTIV